MIYDHYSYYALRIYLGINIKSFKNHLTSILSYGEILSLTYKPTMRSSATFPIRVISNKLDTICTFMGYWLKKRNIEKVTALITIRDNEGKKIFQKSRD